MKITVKEVAYHRNGISGVGFYAVTFRDNAEKRNMVGIVYPLDEGQTWNGRVSILDTDLLKDGIVTFAVNSWRGEHYEQVLRDEIAKYEAKRDEELSNNQKVSIE